MNVSFVPMTHGIIFLPTCEGEEHSDGEVSRRGQLRVKQRMYGRGDKPGAPLHSVLSHG